MGITGLIEVFISLALPKKRSTGPLKDWHHWPLVSLAFLKSGISLALCTGLNEDGYHQTTPRLESLAWLELTSLALLKTEVTELMEVGITGLSFNEDCHNWAQLSFGKRTVEPDFRPWFFLWIDLIQIPDSLPIFFRIQFQIGWDI
jgi:hypothetical protein